MTLRIGHYKDRSVPDFSLDVIEVDGNTARVKYKDGSIATMRDGTLNQLYEWEEKYTEGSEWVYYNGTPLKVKAVVQDETVEDGSQDYIVIRYDNKFLTGWPRESMDQYTTPATNLSWEVGHAYRPRNARKNRFTVTAVDEDGFAMGYWDSGDGRFARAANERLNYEDVTDA